MANDEEGTVVVDAQGRMVLPSRLREKLGIKRGGRVSIRSEDSRRIVIERKSADQVEDRVRNWVSQALSERGEIQAPVGKQLTSTKWMDLEYAKRKLGL